MGVLWAVNLLLTLFQSLNKVLRLTVLILAALALTVAPSTPLAKARVTATARATIIEAARIDFNTAAVRVRKDQVRSVDFE
jgi:hypothetical protein